MAYTNNLSIYQYDEYQELLKDLVKIRKSQRLPFSFRWFSQKAGFTSPNYFQLILSKKRHLSDDAIEKTIQIFKLNSKEAEYFRLLVHFNKEKSLTGRSKIGEQLLLLRSKSQIQYLELNQMSYYLSWKNIAVRECLLLNKGGLTASEIACLVYPQPTEKEVYESLDVLSAMKLVSFEDKKWIAEPGSISSGDRVVSSALVKYHLQMIDLAKESLDRFGSDKRDISNVSVPLSPEGFERARTLIQSLRKEILKISEEEINPTIVAQLNFQLFPIAGKKKDLA